MTEEKKRRHQPRITLGPHAQKFFGETYSIDDLEALVKEVGDLRKNDRQPTSIEEDLTDILDGQADLIEQQKAHLKSHKAALKAQSSTIDILKMFAALTDERSKQLLEEMRYTRAIMGTFLTEGDKRQQVLERLEKSCERREAVTLEVSAILDVDLKKRREELSQIMSLQMPPVVPNGDIEQHHKDVRPVETGDRER